MQMEASSSTLLEDQWSETFKSSLRLFLLIIVQFHILKRRDGQSLREVKTSSPQMVHSCSWRVCNKWLTTFHLIWFLSMTIWSFLLSTTNSELVFTKRPVMNWMLRMLLCKNSFQPNMLDKLLWHQWQLQVVKRQCSQLILQKFNQIKLRNLQKLKK